eukprot:s879_g8.t1
MHVTVCELHCMSLLAKAQVFRAVAVDAVPLVNDNPESRALVAKLLEKGSPGRAMESGKGNKGERVKEETNAAARHSQPEHQCTTECQEPTYQWIHAKADELHSRHANHTTFNSTTCPDAWASKITGAIAFTEKKRLYKKCLYENVRKQGYEKLRELEELLESSGYLREGFDINEGVGDALELSDIEGPEEKKPSKPVGRGSGLPELEGPETPDQFVQKYKKYLLNRRAAYKDAVDRIKTDGCRGHEILGSRLGTLNEMYKSLCSMEIEKKGSSKDVFADLSKRIKDKCLQFNNELNALKTPGCTACRINLLIKNISPNSEHCPRTHFKKPPKKARPPVKDELPNPEPLG